MTRKQTILLAAYTTMIFGLAAAMASALTIQSPTSANYTGLVPVNISANETQDNLSYSVSPGGAANSCANCSSLADSLNLTPGNYTLTATSSLGNLTDQANASFEVQALPVQEFSLTIAQPENTTYNSSAIPVEINSNTSIDSIEYSVDNGSFTSGCTNCSEFNTTLNLLDGNHTLAARGTLASVNHTASVDFGITSLNATTPLNLTIASPQHQIYNASTVLLSFSTNEASNMSYTLNGTNVSACTSCSTYSENKTLSNGNYTLNVTASSGNQTANQAVAFEVLASQNETQTNITSLALTITSPLNTTYSTSTIGLAFNTSKPANITYNLNGTIVNACSNCSAYAENRSLGNGSYSLVVNASAGNESVSQAVNFSIHATAAGNNTHNETGRHFGSFNKLPQQLQSGNITDAQLAELIRSNKINPGVLNRLIKTGLLGKESITAIIQTQNAPPGIFMKLAGFLGIHIKGPREQLLDYYNLTATQGAELLTGNGLSTDETEHVKQQLKQEQKQHGNSGTQDSTNNTSVTSGQSWTPPGLAKKENNANSANNGNQDTNSGRGNSGKGSSDSNQNEGNGSWNNGNGNSNHYSAGRQNERGQGKDKED